MTCALIFTRCGCMSFSTRENRHRDILRGSLFFTVNYPGKIHMRSGSILFLMMCLFLSTVTIESHGAGLTTFSKNIIIQRTNPEYQDFIRQYFSFCDKCNSNECLEYGKKTRLLNAAQIYCELYFREISGLTEIASSYIRAKASGLNYSPEVVSALYQYLTQSPRYDVNSCRLILPKTNTQEESRLSKIKAHMASPYKDPDDMCEFFFLP